MEQLGSNQRTWQEVSLTVRDLLNGEDEPDMDCQIVSPPPRLPATTITLSDTESDGVSSDLQQSFDEEDTECSPVEASNDLAQSIENSNRGENESLSVLDVSTCRQENINVSSHAGVHSPTTSSHRRESLDVPSQRRDNIEISSHRRSSLDVTSQRGGVSPLDVTTRRRSSPEPRCLPDPTTRSLLEPTANRLSLPPSHNISPLPSKISSRALGPLIKQSSARDEKSRAHLFSHNDQASSNSLHPQSTSNLHQQSSSTLHHESTSSLHQLPQHNVNQPSACIFPNPDTIKVS